MKELTVLEKDRPNILADVSSLLGSQKVNIDSISAELAGHNMALIRIATNAYIRAKRVLRKQGYRVLDTDVVVVRLKDRPGELASMTRLLVDADIGIESMHMLNKNTKECIMSVKTDDCKAARRVLRAYL